MKRGIGSRVFDAFNTMFLGALVLAAIVPFYYVVVVSLTDPTYYMSHDVVLFPAVASFASYRFILSSPLFVRSVGVSLFVAVVGTLLSLAANSAFAFALSRKGLPKRFLMVMIVFTMLFNPGMIPNYLVVRGVGLLNSVWSLIVPPLTSAWTLILMKSFFESIPESLDEAAFMDGCSEIVIWTRIALPLALPMLAAFGLFAAVSYWNTYFAAVLYINDYRKLPLQVFLRNIMEAVGAAGRGEVADADLVAQLSSETTKMTTVVLAVVPILMVYPLLQRHFTKGIMLGSLKA